MKPLYEITDNRAENLKLIGNALKEYDKKIRQFTGIRYLFDNSRNRFVLSVISFEAGGVELNGDLDRKALLGILEDVAKWKYSYRGKDGFFHGAKGIPDYWIDSALKALPHEMPMIDKVMLNSDFKTVDMSRARAIFNE